MRYKLYLDDLRYPDPDNMDWRIARSYHDAVWMVTNYGMPYHISFDHDLADVHYVIGETIGTAHGPEEFTGYDFAKWFCNWVMDNNVDLEPIGFTYHVHSANPVGAENIHHYMAKFMRDRYAY